MRLSVRISLAVCAGVLLSSAAFADSALLGAVGVSGAPGGDKDEACAKAAVEDVQEQLDFLD